MRRKGSAKWLKHDTEVVVCGTELMTVHSKNFARILHITPEGVPETQCGFRAMLDEAFRDMGGGVYIQSRQNADLFNVAHFRAKTKTTRILMRELLFADDSALVAHSAEEMQKIVDAFSDALKKFGLKINIKKTEMLYQPNSTRTREEDIMVDGNKLELCSGVHLHRKHYIKK
ncbi:hypothetical protein NP493_1110g00025 [Ridgeia piscesae]|uniref:Reverse transcriptase domain-containing protein n=1 Tax=Ridgeia piscesae TaxID=27915 RepID=A0AAD9NJN7_RIDPI|nr:hypothetical protein NP493_1110g00025 [Ridgeia piscesae]